MRIKSVTLASMVEALPLLLVGWYNDLVNDEPMIAEIEEEVSAIEAEQPGAVNWSPAGENKVVDGPKRASTAEKGLVFLVMAAVILLDQVSKTLIESWLPLNTSYQPFPDIGQVFQLSHVSNTGAAFGLFPDSGSFFMIVAVVVSLVIVSYNWRLPGGHPLMRVALGLQLGGALGNFIDRLRLGHVTDFLDFGPWPVFNLADLAIVSGVILMAVLLLLESPEPEPEQSSEGPARDGAEPAEDRAMIWNE